MREVKRTTCLATLCKWRSSCERWLIQQRMKFLVNNMGMLMGLTRGRAFLNIWKPQYFRSAEAEEEKRDSGKQSVLDKISYSERTVDHDPEEFLEGATRNGRRVGSRQKLIKDHVPRKMHLGLPRRTTRLKRIVLLVLFRPGFLEVRLAVATI
jgi:hypothetical protein